jgi:hypothetical protein
LRHASAISSKAAASDADAKIRSGGVGEADPFPHPGRARSNAVIANATNPRRCACLTTAPRLSVAGSDVSTTTLVAFTTAQAGLPGSSFRASTESRVTRATSRNGPQRIST